MRAFVAIDIPETSLQALLALQSALSVGRPVPEENLHLTLAFMADIPVSAEESVDAALTGLRSAPVEVGFAGLAGLGPAGEAAVTVAVVASPTLVALQAKIERDLRRAGLELPRRRFRPHVTLSRLRKDLDGSGAARLGTALAGGAGTDIPGF
ncbi:MAG: RNA 2',3'-cyclic phosphodiesterase, partial [Pseudomonadota bacterium]